MSRVISSLKRSSLSKGSGAKQLNSLLQLIGSFPELLEYFRISSNRERRIS
jgi:hypothetical protein